MHTYHGLWWRTLQSDAFRLLAAAVIRICAFDGGYGGFVTDGIVNLALEWMRWVLGLGEQARLIFDEVKAAKRGKFFKSYRSLGNKRAMWKKPQSRELNL